MSTARAMTTSSSAALRTTRSSSRTIHGRASPTSVASAETTLSSRVRVSRPSTAATEATRLSFKDYSRRRSRSTFGSASSTPHRTTRHQYRERRRVERQGQITGDDGPNALRGGPGNDVIDGEGGDDTIRGGYGNDQLPVALVTTSSTARTRPSGRPRPVYQTDTVSYSDCPDPVDIEPRDRHCDGRRQRHPGSTSTAVGGSSYDDTITGDDKDNVLRRQQRQRHDRRRRRQRRGSAASATTTSTAAPAPRTS